jgi:hypothetical protein
VKRSWAESKVEYKKRGNVFIFFKTKKILLIRQTEFPSGRRMKRGQKRISHLFSGIQLLI